ncbi:MAG: hypothetical protein Q8Q00_04585 [Dehalococcoidia bacterium]|nr:hypothetical protein [Dehalococcoidia bacterium]
MEAVFVATSWPSGWDAAAKASLAGGLIATGVAALSVGVKWAFDTISLRTQHELNVREKMLDQLYSYACDYLMPLAGIVSELARYLQQYKGAKSHADGASQALDEAFYATARYVRLFCALIGTLPLAEATRPLGLFLASRESEDRVWALMVSPWLFGIDSLEKESIVVQNLVGGGEGRNHLLSPSEFIMKARTESHPLHDIREGFTNAIAEQKNFDEVIEVLLALNGLINHEVRSMFGAWYGLQREDLLEGFRKVERMPDGVKRELGLFYDPHKQVDASGA